jgi:hypothetical protein
VRQLRPGKLRSDDLEGAFYPISAGISPVCDRQRISGMAMHADLNLVEHDEDGGDLAPSGGRDRCLSLRLMGGLGIRPSLPTLRRVGAALPVGAFALLVAAQPGIAADEVADGLALGRAVANVPMYD